MKFPDLKKIKTNWSNKLVLKLLYSMLVVLALMDYLIQDYIIFKWNLVPENVFSNVKQTITETYDLKNPEKFQCQSKLMPLQSASVHFQLELMTWIEGKLIPSLLEYPLKMRDNGIKHRELKATVSASEKYEIPIPGSKHPKETATDFKHIVSFIARRGNLIPRPIGFQIVFTRLQY